MSNNNIPLTKNNNIDTLNNNIDTSLEEYYTNNNTPIEDDYGDGDIPPVDLP